jgi:hypothetical protein
MPALDALPSPGDTNFDEYMSALSSCEEMANKLPLVRVAVPSDLPARKDVEINDVLIEGRLLRSHKSDRSKEIECKLEVSDSLYFHAGRPHHEYGTAVFVLRNACADEEATPFGLGGLLCRCSGPCSCLQPIATWKPDEQKKFVEASYILAAPPLAILNAKR